MFTRCEFSRIINRLVTDEVVIMNQYLLSAALLILVTFLITCVVHNHSVASAMTSLTRDREGLKLIVLNCQRPQKQAIYMSKIVRPVTYT